uniref:WDR19 first beta-propeller domain-containing protein n=1 Tax=Globisporangium ultimum (strain ATCC 200006 / CBS 805.95 / DAOM BR144) TaxID=431595 RepID=K3WN57_GLOUD
MLMLFSVDARHHGTGAVKYAWDPHGKYVASTGSSRVAHIFGRRGKLVDQIVPPSPSPCTLLEWSENGGMLAIVQANSASLVLWEPKKIREHQLVDLPCKDISFMKWSKAPHSLLLAIGTNRGQVYIYDHTTGDKIQAVSKHKRRILCGDWNLENKFAFGSEDRQITICLPDGRTFDQVKIKASPQSITFGGKSEDKDAILSVNMGGKTILLYDLNERENALELAFQSRYGSIVSYQWFGNGYIIAGFSSGYVVIISTHLNEIGQEQYCAKFHEYSLREIVYNEVNGTVATCGDNCIKVVRMSDWKEIAVEYLETDSSLSSSSLSSSTAPSSSSSNASGQMSDAAPGSGGGGGNNSGVGATPLIALSFEDLQWTSDGRILSVSCHTGCLHNFMILSSALRTSIFDAESPLMAIFKPVAPWTMLLTMLFMVAGVLVLGSIALQVTCWDLVRAMTGFVESV